VAWPGTSLTSIAAPGAGDSGSQDVAYVWDYNGVAGDNFGVYHLSGSVPPAPCSDTRSGITGYVCTQNMPAGPPPAPFYPVILDEPLLTDIDTIPPVPLPPAPPTITTPKDSYAVSIGQPIVIPITAKDSDSPTVSIDIVDLTLFPGATLE